MLASALVAADASALEGGAGASAARAATVTLSATARAATVTLPFNNPRGLWSDGTTVWTADARYSKVYAFVLETGLRDEDKDFDTLVAAGHMEPSGLWANETTMWISNSEDGNAGVYAYNLVTKARDDSLDFVLDEENDHPRGLWADETTMWVADYVDNKVYAYSVATKRRDSDKDFRGFGPGNWPVQVHAEGLWSDGTTMWVSDTYQHLDTAVYAYESMADSTSSSWSTRSPELHIPASAAGNVTGLWSDGTTMWYVRPAAGGGRIATTARPQVPGSPRELEVRSTGHETVTVGWLAPEDTGSSPIASYEVRYRREGASGWTEVERSRPQALTETIRRLRNYYNHEVQVRALNSETHSDWTEVVEATPAPPVPAGAPGRPENLGAAMLDESLDVTWDAPDDIGTTPITGYDVQYREASVYIYGQTATTQWQDATADPSGRSALIGGLFNLTGYEVRVRAVNDAGAGNWRSYLRRDLLDLHELGGSGAWVEGMWQDGETMWVADPVTTSADPRLRAFSMATGLPDPDNDFQLTAAGNDSPVAISVHDGTMWVLDDKGNDDVAKVFAYDMETGAAYRSQSVDTGLGYGGYNTVAGLWTDGTTLWVSDSFQDEILAYDIALDRRDPAKDFERTDLVTGTSPGGLWSDGARLWVANRSTTRLAPKKIHAYDLHTRGRKPQYDIDLPGFGRNEAIQAITSDGSRMWYVVGDYVWRDDVPIVHSAPMMVPPSKPRWEPVQEGDGQLGLSWNEPERPGSSDITAYELRWRDSSASGWNTVDRAADPLVLSETLTGLTNGTYYELELRARNAVDSSGWAPAGGTPVAAGAPGRIRDLRATRGDERLTVQWEPPDGAVNVTGYEVRHRYQRQAWVPADASGESASITGLRNGRRYEVQARAVNAAGPGAWTTISRHAGLGFYDLRVDGRGLWPKGIWYDDGIMWIADLRGPAVYAFDVETQQRIPDRDFDVLTLHGNDEPQGLFSDGDKMYVSNSGFLAWPRIYVYDFRTGEHFESWPEDLLPDKGNRRPYGLWSQRWTGGTYLWVADTEDGVINAYNIVTKRRREGASLGVPSGAAPHGMWSDGTTLWIVALGTSEVLAYNLNTRLQDTRLTISLPRNKFWEGAASDGTTMWVSKSGSGADIEGFVLPRLPGRPWGIVSEPGDAEITVSWHAPGNTGSSDITAYEMQYRRIGSGDGDWTDVARADDLALSETIDGLTNGTRYEVRVRAVNSQTHGDWRSISDGPRTVPGRPAGLGVAPGNGELSVEWDEPDDDGGSRVAYYRVRHRVASAQGDWTEVDALIATSRDITDLVNGFEYEVSVEAFNVAGYGEAATARATPSTVPGQPTGLSATGADRSLTVEWTAGNPGGTTIEGYRVRHRVVVPPGRWTVDADVTEDLSLTIPGLANGTEYEVSVEAKNPNGYGAPVTTRAMPSTVPGRPLRLSVSGGDGELAVEWGEPDDGGSRIISYRVRYRVAADPPLQWTVDHSSLKGTARTISGLVNGVEYEVSVEAENGNGYGDPATGRVTPSTVPDEPVNLSIAGGDGELAVDWGEPDNGGRPIVRYEVQYRTDFQAETDETGERGWTAATPGGPPWPLLLSGLANGTTYHVRVRAVNADGAGPWAHGNERPLGAPGELSSLAAWPGVGELAVEWGPPDSTGGEPVHYDVQHQAKGATIWVDTDHSGDDLSVVIDGLSDNQAYVVQVRAANSRLDGPWSRATETAGIPEGVSIAGDTVPESRNVAVFTVTLSDAATSEVTVDLATADGPAGEGTGAAVAGTDYLSTQGRVVIAIGQTEARFRVPVLDDDQPEGVETFSVNVQGVTNATVDVERASATATILDDDKRVSITPGPGPSPGPSGDPGPSGGDEEPVAQPRAGFVDVDPSGVHAANIDALYAAGITVGCSQEPLEFCPSAAVSRAQMATFLARALDLEPPEAPAGFVDVDPSGVHAANIDALFAAGIAVGCSQEPLEFCPSAAVSRAQMATFLARALDLEPPEAPAGFVDVDPSGVHAANIDALFAAGITVGCSQEPLEFCPDAAVTRAQMATFLTRALDLEAPPATQS